MVIKVCWGPKFHKKAYSMKSKEGSIHVARRINIKVLCMFKFLAKKPLKIQWKNWVEIPRGSGSLGHVAQLKWDWDSSKGVPRNTRNVKQICHSQAPNCIAKNQKAWRVTIHKQKIGTLGNPKWRSIRGSGCKTFNPVGMDSAHLGKMTVGRMAKGWA